jgi:hypothetical protein
MESVAKIAHMIAAGVLAAGEHRCKKLQCWVSGELDPRAINYSARPEAFAMATH